jgi:hypothetical protein
MGEETYRADAYPGWKPKPLHETNTDVIVCIHTFVKEYDPQCQFELGACEKHRYLGPAYDLLVRHCHEKTIWLPNWKYDAMYRKADPATGRLHNPCWYCRAINSKVDEPTRLIESLEKLKADQDNLIAITNCIRDITIDDTPKKEEATDK